MASNMVNVENNISFSVSFRNRRRSYSMHRQYGHGHASAPALGTRARFTYNLDRYAKNAMLIIHNNCYNNSDRTACKVKSTFEKFRFEVDVLDNRNGEEILSELDKFFRRDFTEYGSAAVVVVCPMAANGAYKTPRKFFTDDDILKYFENGVVPTLEGKPKIFISEADKLILDKKVNVTRDVLHMCMQKRTKPYRGSGMIPPHILREFCEKLEQFADTKSLLAIIQSCHTYLPYKRDHNAAKPVYTVMSSLSKELWLWKTA